MRYNLGMKNTCNLNVRMTPQEIAALKRLADADGRSMSSMVRVALRNAERSFTGGEPVVRPGYPADLATGFGGASVPSHTPHDATPPQAFPDCPAGATFLGADTP